MNKYIFQWNILLLPYGMQLGAHAGNEPPLVSSLNIILSLSFWYSEMPCSNLFPGCFQGYYRSFWLSNRQEMWSSSSGAVCCSEPALRDLCVTARTSVTAPILLKITFVWIFFFCFNCCGHFCLHKSTALHFTFLHVLFGNCATGQRSVIFLISRISTQSTLSPTSMSWKGFFSLKACKKFSKSVCWPMRKEKALFTQCFCVRLYCSKTVSVLHHLSLCSMRAKAWWTKNKLVCGCRF